MKKIYFVLILFFPMIINASIDYQNSLKIANSYIDNYENYDKYILINDNVSYIFDKTGIVFDRTQFKRGGFLSKTEFEITNIKKESYLSPGIEFWTQSSGTSVSTKYAINYKLIEKDMSDKAGVRVVEYVIPEAKVLGKGTHSSPWSFIEQYKVIVGSNSSVGKSDPDYMSYIASNESIIIKAIPKYGYRYDSNSCAESSAIYSINRNIDYSADIKISNPTNDISCYVYFEPRKYSFELISAGTLFKEPNPNKINYVYNGKWYEEDSVISKLSTLPQRTGYKFKGYTYENPGETSIDVIDENGKITEDKGIVTKDNTKYNLVAQWKANKLEPTVTDGYKYQVLNSVVYSTSDQNTNFIPVMNGTGNYSYDVTGNERNYFSFNNNVITIKGGTPVGDYLITTYVKDTESGENTEALFFISITKQTPTITLNPTKNDIVVGSSKSFMVKSNTAGRFEINSANSDVASVTSSNTTVVNAGTNVNASVTGVFVNSTQINIRFIPSDSNNYNSATAKYTANIIPDNEKPTCNILVNNTNVKLETFDNVKVASFGLSKSSSVSYNSTNNLAVSSGSFYGYVKDAGGNTNICKVDVIEKKSIPYCANSGYTLNDSKNTCYKVVGTPVLKCPSGYYATSAGNCLATTTPNGYTRNYKYCVAAKWNTSFKTCSITSYSENTKICNKIPHSCSGMTSKSSCTSKGCTWTARTRKCSGTYYTYEFGASSINTVQSCTSRSIICNSGNVGNQNTSCGARYGYIDTIGTDSGETCVTQSIPACNSSNKGTRYKVGCVIDAMQWKTATQQVSQCSVGGSSRCVMESDRYAQYTNSCTPNSCPSGYSLSGSSCVAYSNKVNVCNTGTANGSYCYSYLSPSYRKECDSGYTETEDYCYK